MLGQLKLEETTVRRFGLHLQKPTNKNTNLKLPYRELIGSLMYISSASQPDISFSVNYLS